MAGVKSKVAPCFVSRAFMGRARLERLGWKRDVVVDASTERTHLLLVGGHWWTGRCGEFCQSWGCMRRRRWCVSLGMAVVAPILALEGKRLRDIVLSEASETGSEVSDIVTGWGRRFGRNLPY